MRLLNHATFTIQNASAQIFVDFNTQVHNMYCKGMNLF